MELARMSEGFQRLSVGTAVWVIVEHLGPVPSKVAFHQFVMWC